MNTQLIQFVLLHIWILFSIQILYQSLWSVTLTTSSAGKDSIGKYIDTVFVQGKLSLTDATINPVENGEKAGIQLWGERADAAFSGDVNINGDLYIGTRENAGALDIVLDGKDADGEINGLSNHIWWIEYWWCVTYH